MKKDMFFLRAALLKLVVVSMSFIVSTPVYAELSVAEINSIARQTTVLIAPGLTKANLEDLEKNRNTSSVELNDGVWKPGSGVIIAKDGDTYYVLTVAHNFKQRHLEDPKFWSESEGLPYYGIRTSDGDVHIVRPVRDNKACPQAFINPSSSQLIAASQKVLIRFGCRDRFRQGTNEVFRGEGSVDNVIGFDLALVTFESKKNYFFASIGDSTSIEKGDKVYISGWPDPDGECGIETPQRKRRLAWGKLGNDPMESSLEGNGYNIFYPDYTRAGMSGGPVFNTDGQLIAIHGQGSKNKPNKCSEYATSKPSDYQFNESSDSESEESLESDDDVFADTSTNESGNPDSEESLESDDDDIDDSNLSADTSTLDDDLKSLKAQYSSAIGVKQFLDLNRLSINLELRSQLPDKNTIQAGIQSIPNIGDAGQVNFNPQADAFDDSKDVVDNIYELYSFKLDNLLRDEPSTGCQSLLLGEPCQ